jgi:integrase
MSRTYRSFKELKTTGKLDKPGQYAVGPNLYLTVSKWNTIAWVFRYTDAAGKMHRMGLGPFPLISFTDARAKADKLRLEVYMGTDPLAEKTASAVERKRTLLASTAGGVTFKKAAIDYIESNAAGWRDGNTSGSAREWRASLEADAFPLFGNKPVAAVDVADVKASLARIVSRGALESAHRFRARLEAILARANHENAAYANPAASEHLLPPRKGNKVVEHHDSLPYQELPAFMAELRADRSILARALEFAILAGSRSGECREATWDEIDKANGVWRIPAARMKSGRDHSVPLCERAVALLAAMPRDGDYIFPSSKAGTPIGKNSFAGLIERMGRKVTPHGFRATFKTWAEEVTDASKTVIEMCIAHRVGGALEAAYQRSELLAKRRELMDRWCRYCTTLTLPGKRLGRGRGIG